MRSLTDDFDDLSDSMLFLIMDNEIAHTLIAAHLTRCDAILQKSLQEKLEEKQRLETEVRKAEIQLEMKTQQWQSARSTVRKERMQNTLMQRKNKKMREELETLLNQMPMNYKKETLANLAKQTELCMASAASDSNIEVDVTTDSSISTGISGASSHTTAPIEDSSDMEQAFCKRISSSTESDRSSILLYPNMLEILKKRQHTFRDRCFFLGNKCVVCQKKFMCGRMEISCEDCQANVHERCRDRLALPCIPTKKLNLRKAASCTVADFCSSDFRPQIPAFIIHSILTIEQNGLNQKGLYVLPDYSHELTTLKQQLEFENFVPNFTKLKTSVVCELLKHFLSASVKKPLIGDKLYDQLQHLRITKKNAQEEIPKLYDVLMKASEAERSTLCFLFIHLKKVCESPEVKVSVSTMAKVFAPILLSNFHRNDPYNEKRKKFTFIQNMIDIPENYYEHILKDVF